jgi:hypothetical protein
MCRVLSVFHGGDYDWRKRPENKPDLFAFIGAHHNHPHSFHSRV